MTNDEALNPAPDPGLTQPAAEPLPSPEADPAKPPSSTAEAEPLNEFVEAWAAHKSASQTYRLIALASLLAIAALSAALWQASSHTPEPLFVRVDQVGKAEVVSYSALAWDQDPLDPISKYFLVEFLRRHFNREKVVARDNWMWSLYFLTGDLAAAATEADASAVAMATAGSTAPSRIENITLQVTPRADGTHEATATLDRVQETLRGGETRTTWTVSMHFFFEDDVPPHYFTINPIGLVISYLRADEALRAPNQ